MKPVSILLAVLYWADLVFDIVLINSQTSQFRYVTKLLLMPLLFGVMIVEIERTTKWWAVRLIAVALLISVIGDALLIPKAELIYFLFGILALWLVQLCYIQFNYRRLPFRKKDATFLFISTIIILAYIVVLHIVMWEKLFTRNAYLPTIIYSLTLGFMLLTAINLSLSRKTRETAVTFFIPAAILFLVAGSLIMLNRFYFSNPVSLVYIMLSYAMAQFLFVFGALKYIKKQSRLVQAGIV